MRIRVVCKAQELVMKVNKSCYNIRDIRCRNLHDFDNDLYNGLKSNLV